MIQKNDIIPKLSTKDQQFSLRIANKFEIQPCIIEVYIRELLYSLKESFHKNYLIGSIDYSKPISKRTTVYIKYHSQYVLAYINDNWEIPKFRKCIIAALILIHFKLDRNIKTKEEFDVDPNDSAQDYHHYLYDRVKNRFKY